MDGFQKENLNSCDYDSLNAIWEQQLQQLGYHRMWGEDGICWCGPNGNINADSCYEAWAQATGTPMDLKLGIEMEPPAPVYRKPV